MNGIISDELYGHILVVNIKGTCYSVFIVEFKRCSYLHGMKMKKNPEKTIPACYEHFERCFSGINELFLLNVWPTKNVKPSFQSDPLSEVFIIANLGHAVRRIPACTDWREPESRLLVSKRGYQPLFKHHVINRLNHFINDWKKKNHAMLSAGINV